jgi:hypothetical protein
MPCCPVFRSAALVLTTAAAVAGGMLLSPPATGQPGDHAPKPIAQPKPAQPAGSDLSAALHMIPGCLGVETATTASGKRAIFAWFKDKASLTAWCNSDSHRKMMRALDSEADFHKPLKGVPDNAGPLMVIASYTAGNGPVPAGAPFAFSQISIEIYQPVNGGVQRNGRFAPTTVEVKGMVDYSDGAPAQGEAEGRPGVEKGK